MIQQTLYTLILVHYPFCYLPDSSISPLAKLLFSLCICVSCFLSFLIVHPFTNSLLSFPACPSLDSLASAILFQHLPLALFKTSSALICGTSFTLCPISARPNIFVGQVEGSAIYQRWYFEVTLDHIEQSSHLPPHLRIGWANTKGYVSYPGGGEKWGGNGVGDDLYSYGFDGSFLWTGGRYTLVNPLVSVWQRREGKDEGGQG